MFTHLDKNNQSKMVDISDKKISKRIAKAMAIIHLDEKIFEALKKNKEISTPKGPVLQTAKLAGIMAMKQTSTLIPLCHSIALDNCQIDLNLEENRQIKIIATATTTAKTGVEMEALTGATVAALTVYDMCKAFSHKMVINEIKLLSKSGGKRQIEE